MRCNGGEEGGCGGDDVHANATCVFFFVLLTFFYYVVVWCSGGEGVGGGGGGEMTSTRMRLVCSFYFVDFLLIVLVVISGYLLLGFPHVDHAKTSHFCNFPDKNFENDAKIELKKARKAWYLRHFRKKRYQKTRTMNIRK